MLRSPGSLAKALALQPGDQPLRPYSFHEKWQWGSLPSYDSPKGRGGLGPNSDDEGSDHDTYPKLYRQPAPSPSIAAQKPGTNLAGCWWRWASRQGRLVGNWLVAWWAATISQLAVSGAKGRFLRCILIYAITYALCLTPAIANWIGNWTYLTVYITLFISTAPTVGAHLALVGRGFLGVVSGALVSLLAKYSAHELDQRWGRDSPIEGYILLGVWSFVALYVACYFRGKSELNYVPTFLFSNVIIHCLTQDVNQYVEPIPAVWAMVKPMLLGTTITLVLGLILFPTTAMAKLERVNLTALCQILNVLDLTTKSFLLDEDANTLTVQDLEGHIAKVRQTTAGLQTAVTEAQLEMSYSYHRPADFTEIPGVIHKVVRHMGSMVLSVKNEKALLANGSAKNLSLAKLPTTDLPTFSSALPTNLDESLTPNLSPAKSVSQGSSSHSQPETNQFLQVLESLRPTILELACLCELALDQCASELISNCAALQHPTTLHQALQALPQQLLINSQSLLVKKYAATRANRPSRSWKNWLRGWACWAPTSPHASDSPTTKAPSNLFAGHQQPQSKASNLLEQSTPKDSIDFERTLTLTQLFHEQPPAPNGPDNSHIPSDHSPALRRHFHPVNESTTGPNFDSTDLDGFLKQIYQALDRFDRLDTMSLPRLCRQISRVPSFESLSSINESLYPGVNPNGELDATYLRALRPLDDDEHTCGEPFMAFFFLFSLRETVLLLAKLLAQTRALKEQQSSRRRLWLGFASFFWRSIAAKFFQQRQHAKCQSATGSNVTPRHSNASDLWSKPACSGFKDHPSDLCLDTLDHPSSVWTRGLWYAQRARQSVRCWIRRQLLKVERWYKSPQSRYAVRLSLTLVLLCVPAWHPATIAVYQDNKLLWVPLTVCVVSNPTVGQTMVRSIYRITGTLLASIYIFACWYITGGNPYAVFVCNIILTFPCFYIMLFTDYRSVGLIAIIVSLVISFLASPEATAVHTADALLGKRLWTTLLGIAIAGVLSFWWWPVVARVDLRKRSASLVDTLGNLYGLLVAKLAVPPTMNPDNHFFQSDSCRSWPLTTAYPSPDNVKSPRVSESHQSQSPLDPLPVLHARGLNQHITFGMQRAQAILLQCNSLLRDAQVEPSWQGSFPHALYAQILAKLQNVMSRLVTMEIATNYLSPQLHAIIIDPFNHYGRKDMVASLMLNFRTLADSLRSGVPLPPYLPSCQAAHARLFSHVQAVLVQEQDPEYFDHGTSALASSHYTDSAPHSGAPSISELLDSSACASPEPLAMNSLDNKDTLSEFLASTKSCTPSIHAKMSANRPFKRFYAKYVQPRKKKIKSLRRSISRSIPRTSRSRRNFKSIHYLPEVFSSKAGYMLGTFYWMAYSVAMRWVIEELDEVVDLLRQVVGENGLQEYLDPFVD
ncbi:hypothetical protein H4R34_002497 [Dimargaris verticillata]|uniref:ER transporter 6TM N-terminal domain-containing protein n=1 Tax=Dimargaris verticillata TaxID=2761393 RepID=A0A9W8B1P7_9FUNG|nr:hypothetical protein H4R34_002497 [Dimargaris verticillata]